MSTDEFDFFEWIFKGVVGGAFLVGGYLWTNLVADMKALNKAHTELELGVEKNFAKKDSLFAAFNTLNSAIGEIRDDVKDLIRAVSSNKY